MPTRRKSAPTNLQLRKPSTSSSDVGSEKQTKTHKRSRSGCFTCRLRRKKCDEGHPSCGACNNLSVKCEYKRPAWWGNVEHRRAQKELIKNMIKQTKMNERSGVLTDPLGQTRSMPANSPPSPEYDFNRPLLAEPYDLFSSHLPTPAPGQLSYSSYPPYEIDVKTERHTFVNDVPLRHDSSISTFSTFAPPQLNAPLPAFPGEELLQDEYLAPPMLSGMEQEICEPSIGQSYSMSQANIPVSDNDRPLLDHFIHNVLRLIFPVLEINQRGYTRAQAILHALETNKCYLHCCLSVAAIHLKTTEKLVGEQIDHDVVRHRYEAVSQLCQALGQDINHEEILDATLAMIFFHCAVGSSDDYLPDIPWYDHFQAASNLVHRLELPSAVPDARSPCMLPPFSMTLASWIDILGSTMMGKTPHFAHTYRSKHLSGAALGFRELMGCDDRVMYLISEIACLDALKHEGRIDGLAVCSHVSALGTQLEFTEPPDQTLEDPYSPVTNTVRPEILSKNMTMIFRTAARIYLCSLVPGFDRSQPSNLNLVSAVTNALEYIPSGPNGFDRSLVWPLLITGAFSTPSSQFRTVLGDRAAALAFHADLGSFGRMYRVLQEVWRATDVEGYEYGTPPTHADEPIPPSDGRECPELKQEKSVTPELGGSPVGTVKMEGGQQDLHWREVMRVNGWQYLLI